MCLFKKKEIKKKALVKGEPYCASELVIRSNLSLAQTDIVEKNISFNMLM